MNKLSFITGAVVGAVAVAHAALSKYSQFSLENQDVKRLVDEINTSPMLFNKEIVFCHRHPGNGLLHWSNGDFLCYDCGREKYGPKN